MKTIPLIITLTNGRRIGCDMEELKFQKFLGELSSEKPACKIMTFYKATGQFIIALRLDQICSVEAVGSVLAAMCTGEEKWVDT